MPKFFISSKNIINNEVIIDNEDVNHIKNVLRKNIGDKVNVCNKDTSENYLCVITKLEESKILLKIENELESNSESNISLTIYQGLPKSEKMELIIQKSTELGASVIIPTIMKRCVVKVDEKDKMKKISRWQKIAEVAAKQSGRDKITQIGNFININDICQDINNYDTVLLAYEEENINSIKQEIQILKELNKHDLSIAIIIGPEGGIDKDEVKLLKNSGAKIVTLGNRILRTETVSLTMLSILMYELGDLN